MASSNTSNGVEQARNQIPKNEIVVHGAQITCNYTNAGRKPYHLSVPSCHGIMENGKNCAHDAHCIPLENIQPFFNCLSPYVRNVVQALLKQGATQEQKNLYNSAVSAVVYNETSNADVPVPCILAVLDRWFEADEKNTVNDTMKFEAEIKSELHDLFKKILSSLEGSLRQNRFSYFGYSPESKFYISETKQIEMKKYIENLERDISQKFSTRYETTDKNFSGIVAELNRVKTGLMEIINYINDKELSWNLRYADIMIDELESEITKIDNMVTKIKDWKEKVYHLITTNSFLVCRCGGLITFKSSGQEYIDTTNNLMASLLTIITEFKEHCQIGMVKYSRKEDDDNLHEWSSYQTAAVMIGYLEKLVFGETEPINYSDACVHIELICDSFNDEISNAMLSCLSLISFYSQGLSFLLAFYALGTAENDIKGAVDGISSDIGALESVGIITKLGGKVIVQCNDLYSVFSSIVGLFYVSYNASIQNIRITVFTDTHAHIYERWLDKTGKLNKKKKVNMYTKADYITGDFGRGMKWQEEPGVYLKRLEHVGDNIKGKKQTVKRVEVFRDATVPR